MSFGCYGCREATDISPNETVLGFRESQETITNSRAEYLSKMLKSNF